MFLISSIVNGSEKMFLSVYSMLCSYNQARALRHDVQLGEVYNVTIRYVLLQYDTLALIRVLLYMIY